MQAPPLKTTTSITMTKTPTGSPSSKPPPSRSSKVAHLPSVATAVTFCQTGNTAQRRRTTSTEASGKGSVRWTEGEKTSVDTKRTPRIPKDKKPTDPAQIWARYVRTTTRQVDKLGHHHHDHGGTGRVEEEDDGRYSLKLSLPCPQTCCFCLYSRQLGPVKVYVSNFRPPRTQHAQAQKKDRKPEVYTPDFTGLKYDTTNLVFLKERWLRTSAPTGEVIVPDLELLPPSSAEPARSGYHAKCKDTPSERDLIRSREGFWSSKRPSEGKLHALTKSAPPEFSNYASPLPDLMRYPRPVRSFSFHQDLRTKTPVRWTVRGEVNGTRPTPHSRSTLHKGAQPVYIVGKKWDRKGSKPSEKIALYDYIKFPPPFPKREPPLRHRPAPKPPEKLPERRRHGLACHDGDDDDNEEEESSVAVSRK